MAHQLDLPFPAPFAEQLFYGARPPVQGTPTKQAPPKTRCAACLKRRTARGRVCRECVRRHGPRTAQVLAQARRDPAFARSCYERLDPRSRAEFVRLLGHMPGLVEPGPGLSKCEAPPADAASRFAAQ